jgi:hypothetical protein
VQTGDALPSHGELDLDKLCDNVSSNPNELEMDGPVAYDSPSVRTCSEAMEYLEKYEHFQQSKSSTDVPVHVVQSLCTLKMYTDSVFLKKRARQHTLDKYFKEKSASGMNCELVNEKSVTV